MMKLVNIISESIIMVSTLASLDLGTPELIVTLAIVLLLVGSRKLPQLSQSLKESVREVGGGIHGDGQNEAKKSGEKDESTQ